jgi:hypothetical protein
MWHVWVRGEVYRGAWWGKLRERDRLEDLELDGRKILKCVIKKWNGVWTGLIWLRIQTDGVFV